MGEDQRGAAGRGRARSGSLAVDSMWKCGRALNSRCRARQSKRAAQYAEQLAGGRRGRCPATTARRARRAGQRVRTQPRAQIVEYVRRRRRSSNGSRHASGRTVRRLITVTCSPRSSVPTCWCSSSASTRRCARPRSAITSRGPATASTPRCTPRASRRGCSHPSEDGELPSFGVGIDEHRRAPDPRRRRARPARSCARAPPSSSALVRADPAAAGGDARADRLPHRVRPPQGDVGACRPETLGGRPVWILPNPSGLNAHFKPADFARLYGEAREYAATGR